MSPPWARGRVGRMGASGVPCLVVDDLERAARHYREVLGFTSVEPLGQPPTAALARRGGGAVLLQLGTPQRRRVTGHAWDALLFVDDARAVAADLRARGATVQIGVGITEVSDLTLEVRDDWHNVLAFAQSPVGPRAVARAAVARVVPRRLQVAARDAWYALRERPHLRRFQAFYDRLPDRRNPVYMFFTGGLLHWVRAAERLVPREVNLVLVGSAIPPDERRWIAEHLHRPFHNIELSVDDNTVWEFLFAVNQYNFGYLDIDCFVLEPSIFGEMAAVDPGVALNATWAYRAGTDDEVTIGCSHFVFLNATVIHELRNRCGISPTNYDWRGSVHALTHPRTYCRIPTAKQRRLLLKVLPPDASGRPAPPGDSPFFDTLVAYQAVAHACGYPTRQVRQLAHRTQAVLDPTAAAAADGGRIWQQDMSDELVHVGGVSYYHRWFHSPALRGLYQAAEHALLADADTLPPSYAARRHRLAGELAHLGIDPDAAAGLVQRHLVSDRGLSPEAAGRILDTTAPQRA